MGKTKEELNQIKAECEKLVEKLKELSDEELNMVTGGSTIEDAPDELSCGKKDNSLAETANAAIEATKDSSKENVESVDTGSDEDLDIDISITKENVCSLCPSIVSVNRYIMDELGRNDVGYRSIDYVEIDENSAVLCPELAKSLNELNDTRKKEFNESELRFSEAARSYAERMFEETHSEDSDMDYGYDVCVDYEFVDVYRADNVAFSLLVTYVDFWGTDGNNIMYVGYTYDSQTGKRLDIKDVVADWSAYQNAVLKEFERKYGKVEMAEIDPTDYLGWTLTPEGVIIYYPEDYVKTPDYGDKSVQINFDEYPDIFYKKYCIAPDEYAIPFDGNDIFYMDVNGDLVREAVTYSPLGPGEYEGEEYPSYEIYVNGKSYQNFEEDWFYAYKPYYVRRNNKSYIYVYAEGYDHDFITVNRFELDEPICVAKLPATPFYVENLDEEEEEFINRHIAFTNPAIVHGALSFDRNVCGTYKGEEGDGWEVRFWDISNIDGRY